MSKKEKQDNEQEEKEKILKTKKNLSEIADLKGNFTLKGIIFGLLICIVILLCYNFVITLKPKNEIPYVVEVDLSTGNQRIKNAVSIEKYTMTEDLILNSIQTYITNLRTVSTDPQINKDNENHVREFSTGNAAAYINKYFSEEETDPKVRAKMSWSKVFIYNAMPIHSSEGLRFQVDWNEITFNSTTSRVISENNYRADIIAKQYKPTKITKTTNPLGLYITDIYISEIRDGFVRKSN